jgi:hypothetical protein
MPALNPRHSLCPCSGHHWHRSRRSRPSLTSLSQLRSQVAWRMVTQLPMMATVSEDSTVWWLWRMVLNCQWCDCEWWLDFVVTVKDGYSTVNNGDCEWWLAVWMVTQLLMMVTVSNDSTVWWLWMNCQWWWLWVMTPLYGNCEGWLLNCQWWRLSDDSIVWRWSLSCPNGDCEWWLIWTMAGSACLTVTDDLIMIVNNGDCELLFIVTRLWMMGTVNDDSVVNDGDYESWLGVKKNGDSMVCCLDWW